jgi:OPT family oligopeptide transporter
MALQHLTDEQIRTWSLEQKDRWWLTNVFRGDMPQLTLRAALTGFVLGGFLSATNLYIGAKTGWTLGVGLTSVILAFSMFKVLSRLGAKDMTILENNCMQSIATSAGYMTGPLISGIAAYMMVTNTVMPWWQMLSFNVVLSLLGVLVAFPMKRRFINDEQQPFPEGRACGVLLDTLYTSEAKVGLFKAKALVVSALLAAFVKFISGESLMELVQSRVLRRPKVVWLSENLDTWYYDLVEAGKMKMLKLFGSVDPRQVGLSPTLDLAMFGAGGLTGLRACTNMFVGMILCWVVLVPYYITRGDIAPKTGTVALGNAVWNQRDILAKWPLWPGIGLIVCASLLSFFAKPKVILSAFKGMLAGKKREGADVLAHIELPLKVSLIGVPVIGAVGVWMASAWFGVHWYFGALAIPLIIVLTLIAANATALTSITPTGSMSKITQLTFGALNPSHAPTNLMTACMTTEVASNASNLLMDIKPGYMLGAKPRQQVIGHCIGILAGAIASTPLFYLLFLSDPAKTSLPLTERLPSSQFSFTAALQWKGISDLISGGKMAGLADSAKWAMVIGVVVAVVFEMVRIRSKNRSPFSPLALGLGFVLPPDSVMAMFAGSVFFAVMHAIFGKKQGSTGRLLWVETQEPICAGLIAGFALTGIADILVKVGLSMTAG